MMIVPPAAPTRQVEFQTGGASAQQVRVANIALELLSPDYRG
ncbi:hypothetical protein [Nitrosospira sp. Nsp14]|nr:hypothetical protein [Nitrosospira sp. Nsp14]